MNTQGTQWISPLNRPRLVGWGMTNLAFILGNAFWIVSQQWWTPSVVIFGVLFAGICLGNCYLAAKTKAYDWYLAALLYLASPALVIFVAFGIGFAGPPAS